MPAPHPQSVIIYGYTLGVMEKSWIFSWHKYPLVCTPLIFQPPQPLPYGVCCNSYVGYTEGFVFVRRIF